MCGIAAAFAYGGGRIDPGRLNRMGDRMAARGPDGEGQWVSQDGQVGLAHRRLAVIDLSEAAAQPMHFPKCELTISFNGEIYNYLSLRKALEARGHRFRTTSDTEVLLTLYAEYGTEMVRHLRGMFAFALWDGHRKELLLARDPYGIKPLYYADDSHCIQVASQVKALLAGGGIDTSPEPAGHAGFFLWGHVPEPFTMYRGIRALPAGSTMTITADGVRPPVPFASVRDDLREAERNPVTPGGERSEALGDALRDTVRHHLVADVEVGVFLSAGLDSTMLAALASEEGGRLRTVTLGFEEYRGTSNDEVPLAEAVAAHLGACHETVMIGARDFHSEVESLFAAMDQPTTDGLNTYFVSHAAARAGLKVALSGLGGDELFGGYPSFGELPRIVALTRRVPVPMGRGFRVATAAMLGRVTSPKYAGLFEYGGDFAGAYLLRRGFYMPWELPEVLDPDLARDGWEALQTHARLSETIAGLSLDRFKVTALESAWYMRNQLLRDADWAGMAHSLEIRTPLVDRHLLCKVAPIIAGKPHLDKRAAAAVLQQALPLGLFDRPKTGFITPMRKWMIDAGLISPRDRSLRGLAGHVYESYREAA